MEEKQTENKKRVFVSFYRTERSLEFIAQYDKEHAWKRIMQKRTFRRFRHTALWTVGSAACVALLLGVTYLSFFSQSPIDDDPIIALQKTFPETGGNIAFLTLDNGQVVDLTTQHGAIAQSVKNVSGGQLIYEENHTKEVQYNKLTIPRGGEYQLILSDGTRIWMNAESSLHYPITFVGHTREVTLEGEAYFEVAHDKQHPFMVHTSSGAVEVLGTSFNVSAYPGAPGCATLVTGSVAVSTKTSDALLSPGRQALWESDGRIEIRKVDTSLATSWMTGTYVFQNMPLRDIAAQLSRWYDVDIRFRSASLEDIRFTGGIVRSEELAFAVNIISEVSSVKFMRERNVIWVERK